MQDDNGLKTAEELYAEWVKLSSDQHQKGWTNEEAQFVEPAKSNSPAQAADAVSDRELRRKTD